MEELIKSKDTEITKLLTENRNLVDELRQCQADKEFVWSLWKRLQVSSPDLTQAISIIMEREREKAENKDRKVLEILQTKDEEIKDLQETVASLKKDKDALLGLKIDLEGDCNKAARNCKELESEINKLKQHLEKQHSDNTEKSSSYKRALQEAEKRGDEVNERITTYITDIQEMRTKLQEADDEIERLYNRNKRIETELSDRDTVLKKVMSEKEAALVELQNVQRDCARLTEGTYLSNEAIETTENNYRDLKEAYDQVKQHNQHQKELILQLQELQGNTQKIVKEQEDTFKSENRNLQISHDELSRGYGNLKEKYSVLLKEKEELSRRTELQEQALHETEKELRRSIEMATGVRKDYMYQDMQHLEEQVESQRQEIDALRKRMRNNTAFERRSNSPYNNDDVIEQTFSPIVERGVGRRAPRARSLSPSRQGRHLLTLQKRLKATETKLEDTKHLLELKQDEVKEIQRAHNKRLERLKALQADYRALKTGNIDDEDAPSSPKRRKNRNRLYRSDPRNLRHENSETVWNDLAHFKRENRCLLQERIALEEEVDALRVQTAMDRATIQDLNLCLKTEKEDIISRLRGRGDNEERLSSTPKKKHEVKTMRMSVKNLERKLENAAEDTRLLKKEKTRLLEDNRTLKDDVKSLKREVTESRQNATKLRQENNQLRHQVEMLKLDNEQLDGAVSKHETEMQSLQTQSASLRTENSSLRNENSDLRQDVADLKMEIADLKVELNDIDRSITAGESDKVKAASTINACPKCSIKKHQKLLNTSIKEMQEAFGIDFGTEDPVDPSTSAMSEDASAQGDVGRSDASSLGQSIVRASRRQKGYKRGFDEDKDDDDALAGEPFGTHRSHKSSARRSPLPRYAGSGIVVTLKQRVASLQTQCLSLRTAKQTALKKVTEVKEKNSELESELSSCQNKLKNAKQTAQRLSREVDILQREREELQQALSEAKDKQPDPQIHSDADYKYLESKLKLVQSDATRASEQLKEIKRDMEHKSDLLSMEKDKVSRLERDVAMKRQLIDEFRVKIKENETRMKDEHNTKLDLQDKLRLLDEDSTHKKNHIESIRRQLQACTKEKAKYETMYNASRKELEKRCGQLSSAQASKLEAENATSRMEQEAEHQLQTLASRSELALGKLKGKLEKSEEKLSEFSTFVQNLSTHIVELLSRQRDNLLREKINVVDSHNSGSGNKRATSSMSHAQTVACNILNMSRSDFEDLMAPVDVSKRKSEQEDWEDDKVVATQHDQSWKSKVEKIATENPPFAKSLCRLLWDKIQDAVTLSEEKFRIRTEQLEGELLARGRS